MNKLLNIPLVDLRIQHRLLKPKINKVFKDIFESSSFIKGPILERFEKDFAEYIGTKYCVGVASGTDALHLNLVALGIGKDDEVILPVNTFIATAYSILYVGAKPVFLDIDPKTYNIDTKLIENKITKKTKAIIPVHLYGQSAQMDKILFLAKKYKLFIIEDACQAHGATYKGKHTGTFGDLAAFSFYPSKNLGCFGDGGAITTNSSKLASILRRIREYGAVSKHKFNQVGYNSRLDTIQAAILQVKLKELDNWNKKRIEIASYYSERFAEELPVIATPFISRNSTSVFHLYVIRTPRRNQLAKFLLANGVQTGVHYLLPLHLQKSLSFLGYRNDDFPNSEKLNSEILSLPMYPELSQKQQDYIIKSIKVFFKKNNI